MDEMFATRLYGVYMVVMVVVKQYRFLIFVCHVCCYVIWSIYVVMVVAKQYIFYIYIFFFCCIDITQMLEKGDRSRMRII